MRPPTSAIREHPTAILLTMLVAMLGLVLGCGGTTSSSGSATNNSGGATSSSGAGASGEGGSGGSTASSAPTATNTIVIKNFAYVPASLTVAPGTKITVINEDQAPHTITTRDKSADTGNIAGGQRGELTAPTKPGTYAYICTIHPFMTGTLIVQGTQ